jgi:protein-L-isoaspartate O-methyltransferase
MIFKTILAFLRIPYLFQQLQVRRDLHAFLRVHFLYAALETGLLSLLQTPISKEEIGAQLAVQRHELLDTFLEFGVHLGELGRDNGRYTLRGARSRVLAKPEGDPMAAFVQEYANYHGSVYLNLPARLAGAPLGDYLEKTADLVARSSRILEPLMGNYVQSIVQTNRPMRLLEIGCGSGIYLRYAVAANDQITGIAIDMQEKAVQQTRRNLADWGIDHHFQVFTANIYDPPAELQGPFDLITLYNNIYYFPLAERVALFKTLRAMLTPDGALALVSMMQGNSMEAANFDLVLRSTIGGAPLPELHEVSQQMRDGGFTHIKQTRLMFGEPFFGILAQ